MNELSEDRLDWFHRLAGSIPGTFCPSGIVSVKWLKIFFGVLEHETSPAGVVTADLPSRLTPHVNKGLLSVTLIDAKWESNPPTHRNTLFNICSWPFTSCLPSHLRPPGALSSFSVLMHDWEFLLQAPPGQSHVMSEKFTSTETSSPALNTDTRVSTAACCKSHKTFRALATFHKFIRTVQHLLP